MFSINHKEQYWQLADYSNVVRQMNDSKSPMIHTCVTGKNGKQCSGTVEGFHSLQIQVPQWYAPYCLG